MRQRQWIMSTPALVCTLTLGLVVDCWLAGPASVDHVIKIGGQCDRTEPVKLISVELCPGITDYVKLVNKQGGVMGHRLEYTEIEHGYSVDRGVEAYERLKHDGAVAVFDAGTPIVYALTPRHMEDNRRGWY
jgi:branched-chain amino acid transport system substrate-binding protein